MGENLSWVLLAIVLLLLLLPLLVGFLMSPFQQTTRVELIKAPTGDVWNALSDLSRQAQWRKDIKSIQMLDDDDGLRWVEQKENGKPVVLRKLKENPCSELLLEMEQQCCRGTRQARLNEVPGGTRITFTEMQESRSPLARLRMRMGGGLDRKLDNFIQQLKDSFTA